MEVLSLALLAVASGGLLLKARNNSKREGFSGSGSGSGSSSGSSSGSGSSNISQYIGDNPLFSYHVEKEGQAIPNFKKHLDYVDATTKTYNPFAGIFNPLNVAPLDSSGNPPDNNKIKNTLRSYTTKTDSNNYYTYDSTTSDRLVAHYGVESNSYGVGVNYCQNKKIITQNDKISVDCSAFSDSNFNQFCGICQGSGTNSFQSNVTNSGLYIVSGLNSWNEQQQVQNSNNLRTSNSPSFINWQPTVGTCPPNKFSVDSNTCIQRNAENVCQTNKNLGSNGCYQCLANSNYYYVRSNAFVNTQPTTLELSGSGTCKIEVGSFNSNITLSSNINTVRIPLDSNGNAADGQTLFLTIVSSNAYIQGNFVGYIRNSLTSNTSNKEVRDIAITAYDISSDSTKPITPTYLNGTPIILMQNTEINSSQLKLSILIPYSYVDPASIESVNCQGPYLRSSNVVTALGTDSCYIEGSNSPGKYDSNCLQGIFTSAGCSNTGAGYPNDYATMQNLLSNSNTKSYRTLGEMSQYIVGEYYQAITGTNITTRSNLDIDVWNTSYHFCLDKNRDVVDVCNLLPSNVQSNGPIPLRCIEFIFNDGSNDNNPYGTYDRSLYRDAKSLWSGNLKDRFCTSNGSMAPTTSNLKQLQHINSDGTSNEKTVGIDSIKQFYRNLHSQANSQSMTNAQRNVFMQQCYDTTYTLNTSNVDPVMVLGSEQATTNCGVKAKYIKLTNPGRTSLKISQLIAIDSRGQNVALNTTPSALSGTGKEKPVDGIYDNRSSPDIYSSDGTSSDEYYQIDLGGTYDIVQVIVYKSTGSLDGVTVFLLDSNRAQPKDSNGVLIPNSAVLTNATVQYISFKNSPYPSYCPMTYTDLRGNVLDAPIKIQQSNLNPSYITTYPTFTLSNSPVNSNYIWNDPYANFHEDLNPVTFYTTVQNDTYSPISYTMKYDTGSATLCNLQVNNAILTTTSPVTFNINPGSNYIKAIVSPSLNNSRFWASLSNSKTGSNENLTNWTSLTVPSNTFSNSSSGSVKLYNVGDSVSIYTTVYVAGGGWGLGAGWNYIRTDGTAYYLWNQPNANIDAGGQGMTFYLNLPVTGDAVLTYKLLYYVNSTMYYITITVNDLVIVNNATTTKSQSSIDFKVVPGINSIQVDLTPKPDCTGPAGFASFITNTDNVVVAITDASSTTPPLWFTKTTTTYDCKTACAYLSDTDTNIPTACLTAIWNSNNCSGDLPTDNFSAYTMSGFSQYVSMNYYSPLATLANQTTCTGAAITTYPPYRLTGTQIDSTWTSSGIGWYWNTNNNTVPIGTTATFYTNFTYTSGNWSIVYITTGRIIIYLNGIALTGVTSVANTWSYSYNLTCSQGNNNIRVDIITTSSKSGFACYLIKPDNTYINIPDNWKCVTPS